MLISKNGLEQQQNIGWHYFIRGRIPIKRGQIINNFIIEHELKNKDAEQWVTHLLTFNTYWKMWQSRNEEAFGKTRYLRICSILISPDYFRSSGLFLTAYIGCTNQKLLNLLSRRFAKTPARWHQIDPVALFEKSLKKG